METIILEGTPILAKYPQESIKEPHGVGASNSEISSEHLEQVTNNLTPNLTTAMNEINLSVRQNSRFHRHQKDIVTEIHESLDNQIQLDTQCPQQSHHGLSKYQNLASREPYQWEKTNKHDQKITGKFDNRAIKTDTYITSLSTQTKASIHNLGTTRIRPTRI